MNKPSITTATEKHHPEIIRVWELSVRATHDFLPEDYLRHIKELLPSILPMVRLFITQNADLSISGFLGVHDDKIEMLFIHPQKRGEGIGRALTMFAIQELGITKVDVNEQNKKAVGFYQRMGFILTDRTETDSLGKPYPILQMQLPN